MARVGNITFMDADLATISRLSRPAPARAESERLLVEAAGCLAGSGDSGSGRIDVPAALECHRAWLARFEKEHPGPMPEWTRQADQAMSAKLDALGVEPGPCASAITARPRRNAPGSP